MSHQAGNYVKKLTTAPNGKPIGPSEHALLWYLADGHNEEQGGFYFATVKTLAERCGVGERQMRRVISQVERKGIIARIAQLRTNGSQTINRYVFPALGYVCPSCEAAVEPDMQHICPQGEKASKTAPKTPRKSGGKPPKNGAKAEETAVEVFPTPLTPATGAPDMHDRGREDTDDRGTLTPAPPLVPYLLPKELSNPDPIEQTTAKADGDGEEFQEKHPRDMTLAEVRVQNAASVTVTTTTTKWDGVKLEVQQQIARLPERMRDDLAEVFAGGLRETSLLDEGCEGDTLDPTWTIVSTDPEATQAAMKTLAEYVRRALWKTTKGLTVHLKVYGGAE